MKKELLFKKSTQRFFRSLFIPFAILFGVVTFSINLTAIITIPQVINSRVENEQRKALMSLNHYIEINLSFNNSIAVSNDVTNYLLGNDELEDTITSLLNIRETTVQGIFGVSLFPVRENLPALHSNNIIEQNSLDSLYEYLETKMFLISSGESRVILRDKGLIGDYASESKPPLRALTAFRKIYDDTHHFIGLLSVEFNPTYLNTVIINNNIDANNNYGVFCEISNSNIELFNIKDTLNIGNLEKVRYKIFNDLYLEVRVKNTLVAPLVSLNVITFAALAVLVGLFYLFAKYYSRKTYAPLEEINAKIRMSLELKS